MQLTYSLSALVLAHSAMASSLLATRDSSCAAIHIFLAKGNNEEYPGRQGALVNAICADLDKCDYENIIYNNMIFTNYCDAENEGVANGLAQIKAYNARCPDTKLVVSGYSQGAQLVSDVLGGGGGSFFQGCIENTTPGLGVCSAAGQKVVAALTFGNVRHTANQAYNQLTGAGKDGLFPKSGSQLAELNTWTSRFHDYCALEDPICAGGDNVTDHTNYYDIYTDEAAAWVKSMLAADATPACSSPTTTSLTSSTIISTTSSSATPYPTVTLQNGTASAFVTRLTAILSIPSPTTTASPLTVSSAPIDSASLTAYTSTGSQSTAAYTPIATALSKPAGNSSSNSSAPHSNSSSPVPFTGDAAGSSAVSSLLTVAAGVLFAALAL